MERDKFLMKECDTDLSEILQPYIDDGRSLRYGALLVKKIPASRLLMPIYGPSPPSFVTPKATTFVAVTVQKEGLWVIKAQTEECPLSKWEQVKIDSASLPNLTPDDFIKLLQNGQRFGTHAPDQDGSNVGFRRKVGIEQWPLRRGDPALKLAADKMKFYELAKPTVSILDRGAPIRAQTTVGNCHAIYCVHEGQPVKWIVVPPQYKDILELQIRRSLMMLDEPSCPQFIKHSRVWVHPHLLRTWAIPFYEIQQEAGQLVFVFPGSYIWGFATGYGILEKKIYSHINWKPGNDSFCSMKTNACRVERPYSVPPMLSEEDSKAIELVSNQRKYIPRPNRGSTKKVSRDKHLTRKHNKGNKKDGLKVNAKDGRKKRNLGQPEEYPESGAEYQQSILGSPEFMDPALFDDIASITDEDGFYFSEGEEIFTALAQVMPGDSKEKEIETLQEDVQILVTDRNHIHERKEVYKERLYNREKYIKTLEFQALQFEVCKQRLNERDDCIRGMEAAISENAEPNVWRDNAFRGYGIYLKLENTFQEMEKTLEEKKKKVEEQGEIIAHQKYRIESLERELHALRATLR